MKSGICLPVGNSLASGTKLTKKMRKMIHERMPVPNDHKILWADILSLHGNPAGVVITDRALIVKAPKDVVKEHNKAIIEQYKRDGHKHVRRKELSIPYLYRIVPWEYFNPSDFEVVAATSGNDDGDAGHYTLYMASEPIATLSNDAFAAHINNGRALAERRRKAADTANGTLTATTASATLTLNAKNTLFNSTYGRGNSTSGHGVYAEEAGTTLDKLHLERSTVVGRDNAKNGPDKIVNNVLVQCKYYKTAKASVDACFAKNPTTGAKELRYIDLNHNKPMQIEVPADQYTQAIERMKEHISKGDVPGVSEPNAAYDIIRKGRITYTQACNLAKAGTIESLTFDAARGVVSCLPGLGITAVITFAQVWWRTGDPARAGRTALKASAEVYGLSVLGSVLASQLSRTSLVDTTANVVAHLLSVPATETVANALRMLAGKPAISNAAAQTGVAKLAGATIVTDAAMLLVFAIPDTYRRVAGTISGAQYVKNLTSLAVTFTTGAAGGAIVGAKIGKLCDNNTVITAAGTVGGVVAGTIAAAGVRAVGNLVVEDDAVRFLRAFNAIVANVAIDHMLSDDEVALLVGHIGDDEQGMRDLQRTFVAGANGAQEAAIRAYLAPLVDTVTTGRAYVSNASYNASLLGEAGALASDADIDT